MRPPMTAKLLESSEIAPDVRHFVFEVQDAESFSYVPGQFVSFTADILRAAPTPPPSRRQPPRGRAPPAGPAVGGPATHPAEGTKSRGTRAKNTASTTTQT